MSSPSWLATAKQLSEKVHHHLKEEEHKFFQQAGKILKDSEKETLGNKYLKEYKSIKTAISYTYDAVLLLKVTPIEASITQAKATHCSMLISS